MDAPNQGAFREGMRDLGYEDGRNVRMIVRYANGDPVKYRAIIQELIALRVDVLWGEARELREATSTIPIVSPTMDFGDPVRTGLVQSLSRPGGNLTGPATQREDLDPKVLQLTKELLPGLKRLCVVFDGDPKRKLAEYVDTEFRATARQIGVSVCALPVRTVNDIRLLPRAVARERVQAVLIWTTPLTYQHQRTIVRSIPHPLPVISDGRVAVDAGAVMSYAVDWNNAFKRSATYVDKILKGAKPGDLPIEQPTKFQLVVSLKSAEALGIRVPESILVRADEIIR
jgi:putative ABC transport system substrate-binding protein